MDGHYSPDIGKFKYQQKERDLEIGYDYDVYPEPSRRKTRLYDSGLGRFMQVDPHWESYPTLAGYSSMGDNPLKFVDVTGKDILPSSNSVVRAALRLAYRTSKSVRKSINGVRDNKGLKWIARGKNRGKSGPIANTEVKVFKNDGSATQNIVTTLNTGSEYVTKPGSDGQIENPNKDLVGAVANELQHVAEQQNLTFPEFIEYLKNLLPQGDEGGCTAEAKDAEHQAEDEYFDESDEISDSDVSDEDLDKIIYGDNYKPLNSEKKDEEKKDDE